MSDAEVAVAAVRAGAAEVRRRYGGPQRRVEKSATDFAVEADLASERAIVEVLAACRPADGRLGEELGFSGNDQASRWWLIDPLCGTVNFAARTPLASVNVALRDHDGVLAAACADPVADEVLWTDASATWVLAAGHVEPANPSSSSRLVDVNCDGPTDTPFVGAQLLTDPAFLAAWAPRVLSTTLAVAWVAMGRRAAYISDGDVADSVHFSAGIALCQAAGCVVTDLSGGPVESGRGLIAAAETTTHDQMLAILRPHLESVQGS